MPHSSVKLENDKNVIYKFQSATTYGRATDQPNVESSKANERRIRKVGFCEEWSSAGM